MFKFTITLAIITHVYADLRILGGVNTSIEQFPHQVALEYDRLFWCGGAIIGPKHIITAAHCLRGIKYVGFLKVRIGSTHRLKGGVIYHAMKLTSFQGYSSATQDGDVGIVILNTAIQFGSTAQEISLVPEGEEPQHGEMLTVTGWGKNGYTTAELPSILQMVRLPCINREMCSEVFLKQSDFRVTTNMTCAGGGIRKASYKGDSGGALINVKNQVVGIVSWGMGGDTAGYPRVYTNLAVPAINSYIRKTIVNNPL